MPDETQKPDASSSEQADGPEVSQQDEAAGSQEKTSRRTVDANSPEAKFAILLSSIATQALVGLGEFEHPITKKKEVDIESARYSIDLLQVLADKTKGNLTSDEDRYLSSVLYDLRMRFVEVSKNPKPKAEEEADDEQGEKSEKDA